MCGSMADIQSAATEIRRGKKERRKKNKRQDENIMVCPIPYGDHKKSTTQFINYITNKSVRKSHKFKYIGNDMVS